MEWFICFGSEWKQVGEEAVIDGHGFSFDLFCRATRRARWAGGTLTRPRSTATT